MRQVVLSAEWCPNQVASNSDALRLEKFWAKKIHNMGYRVEAGDATPGRESKRPGISTVN